MWQILLVPSPTEKSIVWTVGNLQLRTDDLSTLTKGFESNFSSLCAVGAECIDGKKSCRRERVRFGQAPRAYIVAPYDSGVSRRSLSFRPDLWPRAAGMIFEIWLIARPWHFVGAERLPIELWIFFCLVVSLCGMCLATRGNWFLIFIALCSCVTRKRRKFLTLEWTSSLSWK